VATEIRVWGEGRQDLWSFDQMVDIPDNFEEVPIGDPYVTRQIKRLAETVYVRMSKRYRKRPSVPVAILAPGAVVQTVRAEAERTAEARAAKREQGAAARGRKEARNLEAALAELKTMLPGIPAPEAEEVIGRAFEVSSGRVGRSRSIELQEKLELAVRAHIRHRHTKYDHLLAARWEQDEARGAVRDRADAVYDRWKQSSGNTQTPVEAAGVVPKEPGPHVKERGQGPQDPYPRSNKPQKPARRQ
jgi:hypothetical protein